MSFIDLSWKQRVFNGRMVWAASEYEAPVVEPPVDEIPTLTLDQILRKDTIAQLWEYTAEPTPHSTVTDVVATVPIRWVFDGSAGVYTVLTVNAALHQWNSFKVTHARSGKTITRTVTRNSSGLITGGSTTFS